MIKKNEAKDMIISVKKIFEIIMQYWWIVAITVGLMCAVVIGKGRSTVEEEVETQSVVLISIQAEDLVAERYLENFLIDGRNELTASQNIAKEVEILYSTEKIQQNIAAKMLQHGYENYSVGEAKIELKEATRLIHVTATGNNIQRNVALVNIVADELVRITKEELELPGAKVLSYAESEEDRADINMTYFVKMNFALVALGVILGVVILGVIIIFDKKIRSREEVAWCYEGTYVGCIDKKKTAISGKRVENCIKGILEKNGLEKAEIVSIQKNTLENVFGEKFEYVSNVLNSESELEKLQNSKGVILCLTLRKDKFKDLDEVIFTLSNMNVPVLGYILKK